MDQEEKKNDDNTGGSDRPSLEKSASKVAWTDSTGKKFVEPQKRSTGKTGKRFDLKRLLKLDR
ncbi:MAG: hypothetical protein AAF542_07425 [Pseudomonadota bacterium]